MLPVGIFPSVFVRWYEILRLQIQLVLDWFCNIYDNYTILLRIYELL